MKLKIDHIGFVVWERERIESLLRSLGFSSITKDVPDPVQKVSASFVDLGIDGHLFLEILTPTSDDSPIVNFLKKKGPGLHHLCFEVEDIEEASRMMSDLGFHMVSPPASCEAYDINLSRKPEKETKIAFFFIPGLILIELIEKG